MATTMRWLLGPSHKPLLQRTLTQTTLTTSHHPAGFEASRRVRQLAAQSLEFPRRWTSSSSSSADSTVAQPVQPPLPAFTYSVAASYIAKDRPFDPSTHVFHFNPHNRIQPGSAGRSRQLRPESGQDAFFVSRIGDTGGVALGVADGVGGWMDSGVDPADFSHGLCDRMASAAYSTRQPLPQHQHERQQSQLPLTPRRLMQQGYEAVCADRAIPAGGSTAVVGLLTPDGWLEAANLGDSGFVLLRLSAVLAASAPQVHAFNTPFQLSVIPPGLMARVAAFGGAQLCDLPRDADVTRHGLRHGDVLVFASDGVWDNLFNQDILRIVAKNMAAVGAWLEAPGGGGVAVADDLTRFTLPLEAAEDASSSAAPAARRDSLRPAAVTLQSMLATQITAAAKAASVNTKLDGPFAKEVKKYFPRESWRGGKVDDICVVVAVVSQEGGGGGSRTPDSSSSSAPPKVQSRL